MNDAQTLFNWNNLENCYRQIGVEQPGEYLRWAKDILATKISMFGYENLPEDLTPQILENAMLFNNYLCFWKSPALGVVLCRWRFGGDFNLYWKPVRVELLTLSGRPLASQVPYEDIVPVRDNPMDIIPFITLNGYIGKIIEQEKTLDTLIRLVRFPTILTGSKEQVGMLKQVLKKNANCEGFMVADKGFKDHLEQFDIQMPCKLIEAYEIMEKYRNMALASMGIYSVDQKRERIITAEVNAGNDYVDFVYQGMLQERKRAIEECNAKFGTDIRIVEMYNENKQQEAELSAEAEGMIAKAVEPYETNKGGFPNGD